MQEEWKDVKGFEGYYQVSSWGNVRSLDRIITRSDGVKQFKPGIIKKPKNSTDGYDLITLSKGSESKTTSIHILVAKHFIDNPDNLPEVNHKDFNRKNNHVENLEWSTHQDNVKHSADNGRYKIRDFTGKNNPNYNNHKLKDFYAEHPDKALELLARPGAQNGRAKAIAIYDAEHKYIKSFNYIGECAEYLINNNFTAGSIKAIRTNIRKAINENRRYLQHYFKFIDNKTA